MDISHSTMFESGSTKLGPIGQAHRQDSTGRSWRYSLAGAGNLARGKLYSSAVTIGNHINLSFASAPADLAKSVTVILGGTLVTANQYQDGWLNVQDGTSEGRAYPIEGHPGQTTVTGNLVVDLKEQFATLGAVAESNVNLVYNRWAGVLISSTDQADAVAGVPNVAITLAEYGWLQTYGPCPTWQDETTAIGSGVAIGTGTAGQVEAKDGAAEVELGTQMANTGVIDEYQIVDLNIKY